MRKDQERLQEILASISQIERYSSQGKELFNQEELIQVWIVHHLQIIGEAAKCLSQQFIEQHSEIPWNVIIAFRNILVHEYFRVDLEITWQIVNRDLPVLKFEIEKNTAKK